MRNIAKFGLIIIMFAGCKKTDSPSVKDLLASHTWYVQSGTYNAQTITFSCTLDDNFIFNLNGKGATDEGASKCNPGDPQTLSFDYSLSNDNKKIFLTNIGGSAGSNNTLNITKIDSKELDFNFNGADDNGNTVLISYICISH